MIKYQKPSIKNSLFPIHPGEHLADCLKDYEMTPAELDAGLAVPAGTTTLLLDGCLDITPELALRLGCYFGGSGKMGAIWLRPHAAGEYEAGGPCAFAAGKRIAIITESNRFQRQSRRTGLRGPNPGRELWPPLPDSGGGRRRRSWHGAGLPSTWRRLRGPVR